MAANSNQRREWSREVAHLRALVRDLEYQSWHHPDLTEGERVAVRGSLAALKEAEKYLRAALAAEKEEARP